MNFDYNFQNNAIGGNVPYLQQLNTWKVVNNQSVNDNNKWNILADLEDDDILDNNDEGYFNNNSFDCDPIFNEYNQYDNTHLYYPSSFNFYSSSEESVMSKPENVQKYIPPFKKAQNQSSNWNTEKFINSSKNFQSFNNDKNKPSWKNKKNIYDSHKNIHTSKVPFGKNQRRKQFKNTVSKNNQKGEIMTPFEYQIPTDVSEFGNFSPFLNHSIPSPEFKSFQFKTPCVPKTSIASKKSHSQKQPKKIAMSRLLQVSQTIKSQNSKNKKNIGKSSRTFKVPDNYNTVRATKVFKEPRMIKFYHESVTNMTHEEIKDFKWMNDASYDKISRITLYDKPFNCNIDIKKLQHLSYLKKIKIKNCGLQGGIPEYIGNLPYLQTLDLSRNKLTGSIPSSFNQLIFLKILKLNDNKLSGVLPDLSELIALDILDVENNNIQGKIPSYIVHMRKLSIFNIKKNKFGGSIPENIGNIKSLRRFDISSNTICGSFPKTWDPKSKIFYLDVSDNNISGTLPSDLDGWKELSVLSLAKNKMTGPILTNFASWENAKIINLSGNQFECSQSKLVFNELFSKNRDENIFINLSENMFNVNVKSEMINEINVVKVRSMDDFTTSNQKSIHVVEYHSKSNTHDLEV